MSWGNVEVTADLVRVRRAMAAAPIPVTYIGVCAKCNKKIPAGYLPVVTEWQKVEYSKGFALSKPKVMYCQDCGDGLSGAGGSRRVRRQSTGHERANEAPAVSLKALAVAMWGVIPAGSGRGYSSRKIARLAQIKYGPEIKQVLRKLRDAGKVVFVEGRWKKK